MPLAPLRRPSSLRGRSSDRGRPRMRVRLPPRDRVRAPIQRRPRARTRLPPRGHVRAPIQRLPRLPCSFRPRRFHHPSSPSSRGPGSPRSPGSPRRPGHPRPRALRPRHIRVQQHRRLPRQPGEELGRQPRAAAQGGTRALRRTDVRQQSVHTGPFGGLLRQAAADQLAQRGVAHPGEVRGGLDDPVHHGMLVARPVPERQLARGRVHQDAAEREDVRPRAGLLAEDLLGRHEPGRADDHPGAGQQRLDGDLERAGDAEVDDAGAVDGEQHVGRLQVSVHDPGGVDAAQRPQQPLGQGVYGVGGQWPVLPYGLLQGGSGHIAGRHPRVVGVGIGVQDRGGVAPADAAGGLDLAAEAGPELSAGDVLLVDDLDGDRTAPAERAR